MPNRARRGAIRNGLVNGHEGDNKMVSARFCCDECAKEYDNHKAALLCEISYHGFITEKKPLADDQFFTIGQVSSMTGVSIRRVGMWMHRHGKVFEHMLNIIDKTDRTWCIENGRPDLLIMRDRRTKYLIPQRDVDAAKKAMRLFGRQTGQGFDTGELGAIVVHSESGGAFRVPVKESTSQSS